MIVLPKPRQSSARAGERRKKRRVPSCGKVVLNCRGITIRGRLKNLSTGGLFVTCDRTFKPNSLCAVTFPVWDRDHQQMLSLFGRVARTTEKGMGIELDDMETSVLLLLHRQVRQAVRSSGNTDHR